VFSAVVILDLPWDTSPVRRFLRLPLVVGLGWISYGFYLYFGVTLVQLDAHHIDRFPRDLLALLISTGCALLSYRLVEIPFLRMKRRYSAHAEAA
jgi:peptidoglycan/LPS O-acetylase OafA/YrhL